jgi:hypothetical protein
MRLWSLILLVLAAAISGSGCNNNAPNCPVGDMQPKKARSTELQVNSKTGLITRRDESDKVIWSTALEGDLSEVSPPQILSDAHRVYVRCGDGVSALDWKTGKVLWSSEGARDRMLLSGDLLLAADARDAQDVSGGKRWLVARATTTGTIIFRVGLPLKRFSPLPIREVAGLFLIQTDDQPNGKGYALLVDRDGNVHHQFDSQVVDGIRYEDEYVLLTSRNVLRCALKDQVLWTLSFPRRVSPAGGGLIRISNGDLIAFLFDQMADSGVYIVRLDPSAGNAIWWARCAPLGVIHSEYEHRAEVTIGATFVRVTSKSSSGTFIELLDAATGRQLERNRLPPTN